MERIHYFDEEINQDPAESDLDKQIDQAEETVRDRLPLLGDRHAVCGASARR